MSAAGAQGLPKSGGGGMRLIANILAVFAAVYLGFVLGSYIGTLIFKMLVLGVWRGFQDFGARFVPIGDFFGFIVQLIGLAPGIFLAWLAVKAERRAVKSGQTYRSDDVFQRVPIFVGLTVAGLMTVLALWALWKEPVPDPQMFNIHNCSNVECMDHAEGYNWAMSVSVTSASQCAADKSRSYREGCRYALRRMEYLER